MTAERPEHHLSPQGWLDQFERTDLPLAREMLGELRFVGMAEFERDMYEMLSPLVSSGARIGFMPLQEETRVASTEELNAIPGRMVNKFDKSSGKCMASSLPVLNTLARLKKNHPDNVSFKISFSVKDVRELKALFVVTEFVGDSYQVTRFLRKTLDPDVLSCLYKHRIPIYLAAYAGRNEEARFLQTHYRRIFDYLLVLPHPNYRNHEQMLKLSWKYADPDQAAPMFSNPDSLTSMVFEWRCPDTASPLLWASGEKWLPLFRRNIVDAPTVQAIKTLGDKLALSYRTGATPVPSACPVWMSVQELEQDDLALISYLHMLAKNEFSHSIKRKLNSSDDEFRRLGERAERCGAVSYGRLTPWGAEMLNALRRLPRRRKNTFNFGRADIIYLPKQYKGILPV